MSPNPTEEHFSDELETNASRAITPSTGSERRPAKARKSSRTQRHGAPRHGFYGRSFQEMESSDLETAVQGGLEDEIAMLRVSIRRAFEMSACQEIDVEAWSRVLGRISMASARLAALLKVQKELSGGRQGSFMDLLSRAVHEVNIELGLVHER